MSIPFVRSRGVRWMVPLAVGILLVGAIAFASRSEGATPKLPERSAAQLLADVSQARVAGLSGTVVETARLGLPALPSMGGGNGASLSLSNLVTGSHTVRVWYAGRDKARIAVSGTLAEADVIRNGRDVWIYQSDGNKATHLRLPAESAMAKEPARHQPAMQGGAGALTPQAAAQRAVAAISPTTTVTVDRNERVAGRDAYQLRLAPKDPASLIASIQVAIDGDTHLPLRVRVYAKGATQPAFETGFTSFQVGTPPAGVFNFTPPAGAKVTEQALPQRSAAEMAKEKAKEKAGKANEAAKQRAKVQAARPGVIGSGWTSILVLHNVNPAQMPQARGGRAGAQGQRVAEALLGAATPVQGAFGHGRLLRTALVTVLLTDDGRLYAGPVTPEAIQAAAAKPASAARPLPLDGHGAMP
jgi:outer membrane lipoprotein-sorting protein